MSTSSDKPPTYRVRRATLDDLEALTALWNAMNYATADLKNRLTEFQVAEDAQGQIVATVGFQHFQRQGLIHSEAFADYAIADQVRPSLWERIKVLVMNHGIARLWTRESVPFWTQTGFQSADRSTLERLPEAWDRAATGWFTLRLKDEEVMLTLDKEFALFKETEKQTTSDTLAQTRTLKTTLTTVGILIALALIGAAVYVLLVQRPAGLSSP